MPSPIRLALFGLVAIPVGLVWAWHAQQYLPFMADDAFISLRYSDRLLSGHGLTWSDGVWVEGYTNFSWVVGCAVLGLFTDLITASRTLGALSVTALISALAWFGSSRPSRVVPALAAGLCLAFMGPLAVWTVGGLEQPLIAATLAWSVVLFWWAGELPSATSRLWVTGAVLAFLVWGRPDSPVFVAAIALGVVFTHGLKHVPRLLALPIGAWVSQLVFRRAYYGAWVPNTARLKVAWSRARFEGGLEYVSDAGAVLVPLVVFALVALVVMLFTPSWRSRWLPTTVGALVWTAYVITVGGDIFPGRRHLVVVLVLLALQGALGLGLLLERGRIARWAAVALAVGLTFWAQRAGLADTRSLDAKGETWEWLGESSGPFFAAVFAPQRPVMAVDAAGALPFFARLPAIDMLGLNDADIPGRLPAGWGQHPLSFDLHDVGNADSIMERQPDFIVPCSPVGHDGPCPGVPWTFRLFAHPLFRANYVRMRFWADTPRGVGGTAWLRRTSPIAVQVDGPKTTWLPASLAHDDGTLVFRGGAAAAEVAPHGTVRIAASGTIEVRLDADEGVVAQVVDGFLIVSNETDSPKLVRAAVAVDGDPARADDPPSRE